MRILLFLMLPTLAFCQTFAVDSVYRNGIIHPHDEHEWVVSDTITPFKADVNGDGWVDSWEYPEYKAHIDEPKRNHYFTVCRLCGRKLRWSELPPPPPPKTEFQKVDSAWTPIDTTRKRYFYWTTEKDSIQ